MLKNPLALLRSERKAQIGSTEKGEETKGNMRRL